MRSRVLRFLPPITALVSSSSGTFGGGGGGGDPISTSRIHLPRCTGDVRSAYDVSVRMLPWPNRPRRYSGSDTRLNSGPVTFAMP